MYVTHLHVIDVYIDVYITINIYTYIIHINIRYIYMRQVWKLMKSAPGELVCSVFYCIQFIPPIPYSCSKTL